MAKKFKLPKLSPPVIIGGIGLVVVLFIFMTRKSATGTTQYVQTGPSEQAQIAAAQIGLEREALQLQSAALGVESQTAIALANINTAGSLELAGIEAQDRLNQYEAQLSGAVIEADLTRDVESIRASTSLAETAAFRDTTLASLASNTKMFMSQVEAGLQQTALLVSGQTAQAQINAGVLNNQFAYMRDTDLARIEADKVAAIESERTDRAAISGANKRNKSNNTANIIGGIIGGAFSLFSDEKLKYDVKQIGETGEGIPLYEYGIFGRKTVGVLASEAAMYRPELVSVHGSGYQMVDYTGLN